jgi:hypothetical protein
MQRYLICLCFTGVGLFPSGKINGQLIIRQTFESIGYYFDISAGYSNRVSASARFRQVGNNWRQAITPSVAELNNHRMVVGSIVQCIAGTAYEIELSLIDWPVNNNPVIYTANCTTRQEVQFTGTADSLWVAPNGTGNAYTQLQPGKIENLFTINSINGTDRNRINTATTIICKEGVYYTGGLNYNLDNNNKYTNNSGTIVPSMTRDNPVKIIGEPGKKVVFDGRDTSISNLEWELYDTANKVYKAIFPLAASYSTELMIDSVRMYPYPVTYPMMVKLLRLV